MIYSLSLLFLSFPCPISSSAALSRVPQYEPGPPQGFCLLRAVFPATDLNVNHQHLCVTAQSVKTIILMCGMNKICFIVLVDLLWKCLSAAPDSQFPAVPFIPTPCLPLVTVWPQGNGGKCHVSYLVICHPSLSWRKSCSSKKKK